MTPEKIDKIFEEFALHNPNPRTELGFINNFTLLVSVVLSAQATDKSVNKATIPLFELYKTPEGILQLGEEGLQVYIKSIGLYKNKSKNIIALCKMLIEDHNSIVPCEYDKLVALPGVGRKTANVVLAEAFGAATIAVDTHVYRVSRRVGFSSHVNINKLEDDLLAKIPKKWLYGAHHWLVLHGRYICKAAKPLCDKCYIADYCDYYNSNINKGS